MSESVKVLKMSKEEEARAKREQKKLELQVQERKREMENMNDLHAVFTKFEQLHAKLLEAQRTNSTTGEKIAQSELNLFKDKLDYLVKFQQMQIADTETKMIMQQVKWAAQDRGEIEKDKKSTLPAEIQESKSEPQQAAEPHGLTVGLPGDQDPNFKRLTWEEAEKLPELSSLPPVDNRV